MLSFLTSAQRRYIKQYCDHMTKAIYADEDGDYTIDMDAVADAAGKDGEKPKFYYTEEAQQHRYTCDLCGEFNDILGRFGYCAGCGNRNDLIEITKTLAGIRERVNSVGGYELCVRDCVSAFDSFVGVLVGQLAQLVPLTPRRLALFKDRRFHNLQRTVEDLRSVFDIDISAGLKRTEVEFAQLLFHRRHIYEHNGGEADQKYIADSGDVSVKPKQTLHETKESAHQLVNVVSRMTRSLHEGFHSLFPVDSVRIQAHQKRKART